MIQNGILRNSKLDLSLTPSAYPVDVFDRYIKSELTKPLHLTATPKTYLLNRYLLNRYTKPLLQAATLDGYQIATPDRYSKSLLQAAAPNRYTRPLHQTATKPLHQDFAISNRYI